MTAWYERYPPKKGKNLKGNGDKESREDEDDAGDCEDGGWSTRMLPSFNPQTGSKQSRRP